jgi:hypothetical protein
MVMNIKHSYDNNSQQQPHHSSCSQTIMLQMQQHGRETTFEGTGNKHLSGVGAVV